MRLGREQDHCVWPDFISVSVPIKNDIIPFFFLISTCDCSQPPVPRLIIIKLFPPSHSPFLIFTGIVIFLWTFCRNVSLGQEQRVSSGGSTLLEFASRLQETKHQSDGSQSRLRGSSAGSWSDGNREEPGEGGTAWQAQRFLSHWSCCYYLF